MPGMADTHKQVCTSTMYARMKITPAGLNVLSGTVL